MKVRFSRVASVQLNEILEFIAEESPRTAALVATRVETLVSLLARRPDVGRPTKIGDVKVFRAAPYPYLIFYRIDATGDHVTVIRVRHTARGDDWREGR